MSLFPLDGDELFYRIEVWNDDGTKPLRVLAAAGNSAIAAAAFREAVKHYGHRTLYLRDGARVQQHHRPGTKTP